jgi:DTW domain-containing protein YfiP
MVEKLPQEKYPIATKFFRDQHHPTGVARGGDDVFVLRNTCTKAVVAALRLTRKPDMKYSRRRKQPYYFLRSVCVDRSLRRRGLATALLTNEGAVSSFLEEEDARCYCFSRPGLSRLYMSAGFQVQTNLSALPKFIVDEHAAISKQQQGSGTSTFLVMVRDSMMLGSREERRARERLLTKRPTCKRCFRPESVCICESLPLQRLHTRTQVLVLQHAAERRRKTVSTIPLLPLTLANVTIAVGYEFGDINAVEPLRVAVEEGHRILLLFPGPDAIPLDDKGHLETDAGSSGGCSSGGRSSSGDLGGSGQGGGGLALSPGNKVLLVLLDGTWSEVKRLARDSPNLFKVATQVCFTAVSTSVYEGIRKEPEAHCVSTLEACARALRYLEPILAVPCQSAPVGCDNEDDDDDDDEHEDGQATAVTAGAGLAAADHLEASMRAMVAKQRQHAQQKQGKPRGQ